VPTAGPTVLSTVSLRRRAISGSSLSVGVVTNSSSSAGVSGSGSSSSAVASSGPIVMEVKVLSSEDAYKMLRESGERVKSIQVSTTTAMRRVTSLSLMYTSEVCNAAY
jgi:hypothetical protein